MIASTRPATKIEIKYGVTTDFPDLGLHAAAVTNNLGLATFALTHGQPENSVLHGILPLHGASASGSEAIVKLLLERGADVNAPRLPRRFSSDGRKTPSIGVSGSGPLHFAASNGHLNVVKMLLSAGARHDMEDKHGLRPEDLALAAGHEDIVQTLRAWGTLRASLRERDGEEEGGSSSGRTREQAEEDEDFGLAPLRTGSTGKKKSGVKKSLDIFGRGRRSSSSASTPNPELRSLRHASSKTSLAPSTTSSFGPTDSALDVNSPIESSSSSIQSRRLATDAPLTPLPSHVTEPKSRRPSLPSILEKAAHSIAHPHRSSSHHRHYPDSAGPGLVRAATFNSVDESDSGSISSSRRFTSNKALLKIFNRTHLSSRRGDPSPSPPSASPSPPSRLASLPVFDDDDDVDRTIEELRRQSYDGGTSMLRTGSLKLPKRVSNRIFGQDDEDVGSQRSPPPSAPAGRTSFSNAPPTRHRSSSNSSTTSSHYFLAPQTRPNSTVNSPELTELGAVLGEKSFYRPRKGSEVVSPSPLAAEWSAQGGSLNRRRVSDRSDARSEEDGQLRSPQKERVDSSGVDYSEDEEDDQSGSDAYRSPASSTRPDHPSHSVSSPGSSYRNSSLRQQPISASPSKASFATTSGYGTSSTDRPPLSAPSSNASSLRKVASANLRQGGRIDSGDSYAPYSADPPLHSRRTGSLEDETLEDAREALWAERGYEAGGRTNSSARRAGLLANGRSRGASFTSSLSSAFSTSPNQSSPALTPPKPSLEDEDDSAWAASSTSQHNPPITISVTSPRTGRSRNVSVSSVSSNASGRGGHVSASTNGTSYTAPSLLSSGAPSTSSSGGPSFPSVPEHPNGSTLTQPRTPTTPYSASSNSPGSGTSSFPSSPRRVSSRREAQDLVRAAEKSILDRPTSSESVLSLSAQLAAYGEKLAIEREFARTEEAAKEKEIRDRKGGSRNSSLDLSPEGTRQRSRSRGDESQRSGDSGDGQKRESKGKQVLLGAQMPSILDRSGAAGNSSLKGGFAKHVQERSRTSRSRNLPPNPLITIEAPPSQRATIPNVAQIYSNRAEALRQKGIAVASALASSPLASPRGSLLASSSSSHRPSHSPSEGDRQLWIISGHGNGATGLTRTPPTPEGPSAVAGDERWTKTRQGSLDTVTSGESHQTYTHHHHRSPLVPPPPPSSISPSQSASNRGRGSSVASSVPPSRLIPPINTTSPLPPPSSNLIPPSALLHPPASLNGNSSTSSSPRRVPSPKPSIATSATSTNGLPAVPKFEILKRSGEGGEVKTGKGDLIGLGLGLKEEVVVGLGGGKNTVLRKPSTGGPVGWGAKIFGRRG